MAFSGLGFFVRNNAGVASVVLWGFPSLDSDPFSVLYLLSGIHHILAIKTPLHRVVRERKAACTREVYGRNSWMNQKL